MDAIRITQEEAVREVTRLAPRRVNQALARLSDAAIKELFDALYADVEAERNPLNNHRRVDP